MYKSIFSGVGGEKKGVRRRGGTHERNRDSSTTS